MRRVPGLVAKTVDNSCSCASFLYRGLGNSNNGSKMTSFGSKYFKATPKPKVYSTLTAPPKPYEVTSPSRSRDPINIIPHRPYSTNSKNASSPHSSQYSKPHSRSYFPYLGIAGALALGVAGYEMLQTLRAYQQPNFRPQIKKWGENIRREGIMLIGSLDLDGDVTS